MEGDCRGGSEGGRGEAGGELRNLGGGTREPPHERARSERGVGSLSCGGDRATHEGMSTQDYKQRGGWLPEQDDLESWLKRLEETERESHEPLHPAVERLRELVESDPTLRMYAIRTIEQVPTAKPYGRRHLHSLEQLLRLINQVITLAPEFSEKSMVMTPLAGLLEWTMGTPAGFAFYRDPA